MIVTVGDAIDVFCYGLGHNKVKTMTVQLLHKLCRSTTAYHQEVGDLTLPVQGSEATYDSWPRPEAGKLLKVEGHNDSHILT